MILRPPISTLSSSSAASDVYKRQDLLFVVPFLCFKLLIFESILPLDLKLLKPKRNLVQYNINAVNAFAHHLELIQCAITSPVKLSYASDLIEDLATLKGAYLDDSGNIPLSLIHISEPT